MNIEQAIGEGSGGVVQFSPGRWNPQGNRLPETMQRQIIDSANVEDKADFLRKTATAMRFPHYFGENWDAFYDCLTDIAEPTEAGMVVVFTDLSRFARGAPAAFQAAIEIMTDAVSYWERAGNQLLILVGLDDPGLAPQLPAVTNA